LDLLPWTADVQPVLKGWARESISNNEREIMTKVTMEAELEGGAEV
jgi:hypothetical protein